MVAVVAVVELVAVAEVVELVAVAEVDAVVEVVTVVGVVAVVTRAVENEVENMGLPQNIFGIKCVDTLKSYKDCIP